MQKTRGALYGRIDKRDYQLPKAQALFNLFRKLPPKACVVDGKNIPVYDQDGEGMCVAYSLSLCWSICNLLKNGKWIDISQRCLYEHAKQIDEFPGEAYEGTTERAGCKSLAMGVCKEEYWHTQPTVKTAPHFGYIHDANYQRISAYYSLVQEESNKVDIKLLKSQLTRTPIVATFKLPNHFEDTTKVVDIYPLIDEDIHEMCIIGYDDTIGGGSLLIQNSWSKDWGENGRCYYPYKLAEKSILNSRYIML